MSAAASKTALVTAGTKGIGLAVARALAGQGYDLAVTGRDPQLDELLASPELQGRQAIPVKLDLLDQDSIVTAMATAVAQLGSVDVLVNNAGNMTRRPAIEARWTEWDEMIDVNLKGTFFLSVEFARHCLARGGPGVIVNIGSTHGFVALAGRSVYGISKAGLMQMTRSLAIEWAAHGIRVNTVAPATVMTASRQAALSDPAVLKDMLSRIPSGSFVTEEEVAAAVCFLASEAAASITGHTLPLDGGLLAQ